MADAAPPPGPTSADAPQRPGPHTTDHLANERTFLAWIRTSIALISLGFVVAKFSVWLRQFLVTVAAAPGAGGAAERALPPRSGLSLPAGVALMGIGGAVAILASVRHGRVGRAIDRGEFRPARGLVWLVTATVVVAAAAFIAYLSATAGRL